MTKEEQVLALAEVTRGVMGGSGLFYNKEAKLLELKTTLKTATLSCDRLSRGGRYFWKTVAKLLQNGLEENPRVEEELVWEVANTLSDGEKHFSAEIEDCTEYAGYPSVVDVWLDTREKDAVKEIVKYGRLVKSISRGDLAFCQTAEIPLEESQSVAEWIRVIENHLDDAEDRGIWLGRIADKFLKYQENLAAEPAERKVRRTPEIAGFLKALLKRAAKSSPTTILPTLCWAPDRRQLVLKNYMWNSKTGLTLMLEPSLNGETLTRLLHILDVMDDQEISYHGESNTISTSKGLHLNNSTFSDLATLSKNTETPLGRELLGLAQWLLDDKSGISMLELENWLYE